MHESAIFLGIKYVKVPIRLEHHLLILEVLKHLLGLRFSPLLGKRSEARPGGDVAQQVLQRAVHVHEVRVVPVGGDQRQSLSESRLRKAVTNEQSCCCEEQGHFCGKRPLGLGGEKDRGRCCVKRGGGGHNHPTSHTVYTIYIKQITSTNGMQTNRLIWYSAKS